MDFLSSFSSSLSVLLDRMKTCLSNRFAIRRNALFDESSIGFSSVITYAGILVNWRCRFMEYLQFLLFRWKFNSIDESWTFWWYRFIKNFIPSVIIDTVRSKDREKRIQNYISSNSIFVGNDSLPTCFRLVEVFFDRRRAIRRNLRGVRW